ncbi:MAG TPA: phosphoribosylglycinamide formyltransferase [Oligoflexia bacterium]|nr:phosphoribosylglycinamide formyltransferase [Oligoflexia bacterium]HMR23715.1 phosphoribosylglycinamide formyltransferase [Oligoflexia bacterium]
MKKKTQIKSLLVMASGNGSNFEAIVKACHDGEINAQVTKLISDNPKAYVFQRAKQLDVVFECIDYKSFPTRSDFEHELLQACLKDEPEYIVLAGFMKILPKEFIYYFKQRIINIHPSLLPLYPGTKALEKAWNNKDRVSGVTVHYVDEGVDTGEIILQRSLNIDYKASYENFCQKMHALEHEVYVEALQKLLNRSKDSL